MNALIKKIKNTFLKDGALAVIQKGYRSVVSNLLHGEAVFIWDGKKCKIDKIKRERINVREGKIADCEQFSSYFSSYLEQCQRRLTNNDKIYVALIEEKVAYIMWVKCINSLDFSYVDREKIELSSESLYIYNCFTLPKYRGMSIYPYMLDYVARLNPQIKCYVACRSYETVSMKGIYRAGFRLCWKFYLLKIGQIKLKWKWQYF